MEKTEAPVRGRGGRPPKTDTAKNCVMVRFTDGEYARFLALFEQSGTLSKAAFVKARVFGDEFRVIRSDRGTMEFAARLTAMVETYAVLSLLISFIMVNGVKL